MAVRSIAPDNLIKPLPLEHTVVKGDSFWSIKNHYQVSESELVRVNGGDKYRVLQPGDVLALPPHRVATNECAVEEQLEEPVVDGPLSPMDQLGAAATAIKGPAQQRLEIAPPRRDLLINPHNGIRKTVRPAHEVLFVLMTKGASRETAYAQEERLKEAGEHGIAASRFMASEDYPFIAAFRDEIIKAAAAYPDIPPALLFGIASRETRGGQDMGGEWVGVMQLRDINGETRALGLDTPEHFMEAARRLNEKLRMIRCDETFGDWSPARQLRAAVAAYNFGNKNVRSWENLDVGTPDGDYSADVWARAQYFAEYWDKAPRVFL